MLWEFPFVEEAESAHAEGEYGRDRGRGSEEGGGVEDSAIAAKGCSQVNLLGKEGGWACVVRGSGGLRWYCVEREGKEGMEVVRRCRLEDKGYRRVSYVDMSPQWVSVRVLDRG